MTILEYDRRNTEIPKTLRHDDLLLGICGNRAWHGIFCSCCFYLIEPPTSLLLVEPKMSGVSDSEQPPHLRLLYETGPQTDESCLVAKAGDILVRLETAGEWHLVMHYRDKDKEHPATGYVPCTYVEEFEIDESCSESGDLDSDTSLVEEVPETTDTSAPDESNTTNPDEEHAAEKSSAPDPTRAADASVASSTKPLRNEADLERATAELGRVLLVAQERRSMKAFFSLQAAFRTAVAAGMETSALEAAAARELIQELQHGDEELVGGKRYKIDFDMVLADTGESMVFAGVDRKTEDNVAVKLAPRNTNFTREVHRFVAQKLAARLKRRRGKTVAYAEGAVAIRDLVDTKSLGSLPTALRRRVLDERRLHQAVVMDRGVRSLHSLLSTSSAPGTDFNACMEIFFSVAVSTYHLHSSKRVHGQICPKKVLQLRRSPDLLYGSAGANRSRRSATKRGFLKHSAFKLCGLSAQAKFGAQLIHPRARPQVFDAPEVVRSIVADHSSPFAHPSQDIWALGCILFQLATGRLLFSPSRLNSDDLSENGDVHRLCNWRSLSRDQLLDFFSGMQSATESRQRSSELVEIRQLLRACLQSEPSSRPTIQEILCCETARRFVPETVRAKAQARVASDDCFTLALEAERNHFLVTSTSSETRAEALEVASGLRQLGCKVMSSGTWGDVAHADPAIDAPLKIKSSLAAVSTADVVVVVVDGNKKKETRLCYAHELMWAVALQRRIVVIVQDSATFFNFTLDLFQLVKNLDLSTTSLANGSSDILENAYGMNYTPNTVAKNIVRELKSTAEHGAIVHTETTPSTAMWRIVMMRAVEFGLWGGLGIPRKHSFVAEAPRCSGSFNLAIHVLVDGRESSSDTLRLAENLFGELARSVSAPIAVAITAVEIKSSVDVDVGSHCTRRNFVIVLNDIAACLPLLQNVASIVATGMIDPAHLLILSDLPHNATSVSRDDSVSAAVMHLLDGAGAGLEVQRLIASVGVTACAFDGTNDHEIVLNLLSRISLRPNSQAISGPSPELHDEVQDGRLGSQTGVADDPKEQIPSETDSDAVAETDAKKPEAVSEQHQQEEVCNPPLPPPKKSSAPLRPSTQASVEEHDEAPPPPPPKKTAKSTKGRVPAIDAPSLREALKGDTSNDNAQIQQQSNLSPPAFIPKPSAAFFQVRF